MPDRLASLEGMEVGWSADRAGACDRGARRRRDLVGRLRASRVTALCLGTVPAPGHRSFRRELPNFATEVYTLLALVAIRVRSGAHDAERRRSPSPTGSSSSSGPTERGPGCSTRAGHRRRGGVRGVLRAPGRDGAHGAVRTRRADEPARVRRCRRPGASYGFGMQRARRLVLRRRPVFAHRSIRRRRPYDRRRTRRQRGDGEIGGSGDAGEDRTALELNRTCRPYHLGWILEAWSGREEFAQLLLSTVAPQ